MRTLDLFENSDYNEDAGLEEGGYRNYDDNRTGFGRPSRDMSDEANMMYRYDTADGKLKQRMIANPQRQQAFNAGFKDTHEEALKAHNIIRSKFGANKYVQKQGAKWVPVYPYGEQGVAEGSQQVDSLVTDALKIMQGPKLNDAVQALKTVLGDREYNSRRGFYNFYVRQIIDMYGQQGVNEGVEDSPVAGAITRRILMQRTDLLSKYGPEKVTAAIDEVADFVGDVDEIGSSDVSGWVKQVEQSLGGVNETNKQGTPQSHQAKTTLKHLKKASYGDRADAANIKSGISGVADRIKFLQRAKDEGNLVDEAEISQSRISKMNTPNQEFYGKNPHFAKGGEVKNIGKTVDATGKPVSALATKVTPQFNKPAPVKKLRATPFEEDTGDLQQRLGTLESAMVKARNITKAIKYDGTVSDILVSIRQLAENAGIDARDLSYAENEVFDAKKQLESAIYGLDEVFEDAIQNLRYQLDSED
jgi:hypothetical protein